VHLVGDLFEQKKCQRIYVVEYGFRYISATM